MSVRQHHVLRHTGPRPIYLTTAADANNVVLFTLAGSPGQAVILIYRVNSGVWIGSTSAGSTALTISGFAAGSKIHVFNFGNIVGAGGGGGYPDSDGGAGGDAIALGSDVIVDNTYGLIAGGGGGGGGGRSVGPALPTPGGCGGGGGGGGQGSTGGVGQPGSTSYQLPGYDGSNGSRTAPGPGGSGQLNLVNLYRAGSGGPGGGLGQSGVWSSANSIGQNTQGGAGGYAIRRNGKVVTWLGGNNASQVLGLVA